MAWHRVAKVTDLKDGEAQTAQLEGHSVAVFRLKGKFYAMDNRCPHRGGPLADGHLEGDLVTCPWHAWQFDVTSGKCENAPEFGQTCYATKVEKDELWVEVKG